MMNRLILAAVLLFTSCKAQETAFAGDAARGKQVIQQNGCTACHAIPGIEGPRGMVGPSLERAGAAGTIAGKVPNTPENLAKWIQNPQAFTPESTMPALGLSDDDARDAAAYLSTLR
jgi:cytochrome c2